MAKYKKKRKSPISFGRQKSCKKNKHKNNYKNYLKKKWIVKDIMKQEQFLFFEKHKTFKNQLANQETKKKKKQKSWNLKKKRVELTPTFSRKKRGNTNLNKESNQVQNSETRVQRSKGVAMEEWRKEQWSKEVLKQGSSESSNNGT